MSSKDDDAKLFRQGLIWASSRGNYDNCPAHVAVLYERLNGIYSKISDQQLEQTVGFRNKDSCTLSEVGFVFLEYRGPSWSIPVLTAKWDFTNDPPTANLRIALFHPQKDDAKALVATGYRFDIPHPDAGDEFHHVQPITKLVLGEQDIPGCQPLISTKGPSFPIDASGPTDLVICLLLSLYGSEILSDLALANRKFLEHAGKNRRRFS